MSDRQTLKRKRLKIKRVYFTLTLMYRSLQYFSRVDLFYQYTRVNGAFPKWKVKKGGIQY